MPRFSLALLLGLSLCTRSAMGQATAGQAPTSDPWLERWIPHYTKLYRYFHAHPELSFHEEQTAAVVQRDLLAYGFEVTAHCR